MTSNILQMRDGAPHFVLHEDPPCTSQKSNYVCVEMINVLLANNELNILNKTKNVPEGTILGGVGIGRVVEVGTDYSVSPHGIEVGAIVVLSSKVPCLNCPSCHKQRWEDCRDPKISGVHTNGVAASHVWRHVGSVTALDVNPQVENVRQFLLHEVVSTGIWLSAQDFITKDTVVGVVGRSFITNILKSVIEDLSSVEVVSIQQSLASGGVGRFDVIVDCDGETLLPEDIIKLIRPGGVLVHSYTGARATFLDQATSASPLKQVELRNGPSFLAVEWITQNPQTFKEMGVAFDFSPNGLQSLLKNEGLRENHGFLYFDMRPQWTQWSNLDQGVVLQGAVLNASEELNNSEEIVT